MTQKTVREQYIDNWLYFYCMRWKVSLIENLNILVSQLDQAHLPSAKSWVREAITELAKSAAVRAELDQAQHDLSDALDQIRRQVQSVSDAQTHLENRKAVIDRAARHILEIDPPLRWEGALDAAVAAAVAQIKSLCYHAQALQDIRDWIDSYSPTTEGDATPLDSIKRIVSALEGKLIQWERAVDDLCEACDDPDELARICDLHPILEEHA